MILKSLQLQGFKSFPDKTTLTFDRGTTVVVGPNGSGKSNIADAMRWVLGEISSKNLRGNRMEDVIFGGADSRKQMGFAEVSVTFDNTEGERLATTYDEVTVTRRYYRSGDSEYFINAKPVRLRDIHELFLNTGIGREGYSIIGQGKIAEIISRKSDERRSVFEEAAGIAKYKYKKQEAEKKLLGVEDNLTRVSDIVSELEGRVGPLEKESQKARTYLALYDEKKEADISLWLYDMDALKAEIVSLSDAFRLSKNDYDRASLALEELEAQSEQLYLDAQAHKAEADALQNEITLATAQRSRLETECSVLENEIAHIAEKLGANASETSTQSKVLADTREKLAQFETYYADLTEKLSKATEKCEIDRQTEEDTDRRLDEAYARITALGEEIALAMRGAGDIKAELSALESSKTATADKQAEIEENRQKYEENIALLEERLARAKESAQKYRDRSDAFEKEAEAARTALADIAEKKKVCEEKQNEAYLAYSEKKNRIDALSRMEELFEGYSRAVRFVMSDYEKGKLSGITLFGPLSKLISVKPKYATAIETALGANIQNIACADEKAAKAAILHLKNNNAGRATFYPIDTVRAQDFNYALDKAQKQAGFVGLASTLVSCEDKFDVLIRSLLGRTFVTDNIDHAAELARAYDYKVRVVTLDGQQVNAGGSFTGGSVKHDSGMLTRTVEIERLRKECEALAAELEARKTDFAALDKEAKKHTDTLENVRVNSAMIATLSQAEETQSQVISAQLQSDRDMLASLAADEEKLLSSEDVYRAEHERLSARLAENEANEQALREERTATESKREQLKLDLTEAQKTLSRHRIAEIALQKDVEVMRDRIAQTEESIAAMMNRSTVIGEESKALGEQRKAHTEKIEANKAEMDAIDTRLSEMDEKRKSLASESLLCEQKSTALRAEIKEKTHTKELLFRTYTNAENKHAQALSDQDKRVSALWDEYELTYSSAALLGYPPVTADNRTQIASALASLKSKIKALGPVNVSAIEEYTQVKERFDFMTAQINDLTASRTELSEIIFRLEGEMRTRFSDAMREINHHFQAVFRELFGGGHAELILSEPDNILESGIEINVAPPGKIIKNLMLLSGGEQSFVAIALYFALLKVNPSPFCILDEIEAALDEVNVDKFADYLHRNSEQTQYIVITHRRGTMEVADRLYGVTMVEKGISTILSVKADEVGKLEN